MLNARIFAVGFLTLMLAGCGQQHSLKPEQANERLTELESFQGIVLYRKPQTMASLGNNHVYIDDKPLGWLHPSRYVLLPLKPGQYNLQVNNLISESCHLGLTVAEGEPTYVEVKLLGMTTGLFMSDFIAQRIERNRDNCAGHYQSNLSSKSAFQAVLPMLQKDVLRAGRTPLLD